MTTGSLLPAGETGEIVIRGANVTAGYANNPEANEAAFSDGWFRTGDLGRTDEDGYFYYHRSEEGDDQPRWREYLAAEIDEVLLEHPAVAQAVAFAVPHPSSGEDVAAAVVLQGEADVSEHDLREYSLSPAGGFKVPSRILSSTRYPKARPAKLQRIGLHEEFASLLQAEYVAAEGPFDRNWQLCGWNC